LTARPGIADTAAESADLIFSLRALNKSS